MHKEKRLRNRINFGDSSQKPRPNLPLILAKAGKKMKIDSIEGGYQVQSRLADIGMLPGVEVQVLNGSRSGPLLVMVKGSRFALGRGLSSMIMVEEG